MRLIAIAAIMIMLSGCAVSQQKPVPRIPFPAAEFAALPTKGTGTLTGQVFMKTVGGDVKFGAGSTVYLVPVTSYSKQWYEVNYIGGQALEAPDPRSGQGPSLRWRTGTETSHSRTSRQATTSSAQPSLGKRHRNTDSCLKEA